MSRVMIAGTNSGCGKTTIVCGILQALINRNLKVNSFKCGPDYIDPMFHSEIIGSKSRNLDGFFMDKDILQYLLYKNTGDCDISIIEGVMGYYDGIAMTDQASSYQVARDTDTPVILVVPCKGMSRSVQALLNGFVSYASPSQIKGVIFNQLPESLYREMEQYCQKIGLRSFGFFPMIKDAQIESRHLGLVTAQEIADLKRKLQLLAQAAEQYLDLDALLALAKGADKPKPIHNAATEYIDNLTKEAGKRKEPIRIAVAKDRAFCFYYEDNLELLKELGCEIVPFSPLEDAKLPDRIDGLILGGGYPELYGRALSENKSLLAEIKEQIEHSLPTHAECGGFMYLHEQMTDITGDTWSLVGALPGSCSFTSKLQHFGYAVMTANEDNLLTDKGDSIKIHEFHRCVSDLEQNVFATKKGAKSWGSYVQKNNLLAGFAHIHYYANLSVAKHFVENCEAYHRRR